jgi:pyruvate/2-oxoglutarate dehydrogenase complex dihydrolipoamide dehydrogenase (E3) component
MPDPDRGLTIARVSDSTPATFDVVVIGAGPAGVVAALRAARLGARTALITRDDFGGMAANDGPVPVRTLAYAARLIRETRQLPGYGIAAGEPALDYEKLLERVREVTREVRTHSLLRQGLRRAGVVMHEHAGIVRFSGPREVESERGPRLRARNFIVCVGGMPRRLEVDGFDLTSTHSDAWELTAAPPSMAVVGAGATGVQVASIFNAFGSRVHLIEAAPRILMTEDEDVSSAVRDGLEASGIRVVEDAERIARFERSAGGVRVVCSSGGSDTRIEAAVAVVAVGWLAAAFGLNLDAIGVRLDERGYIRVDEQMRTTAGHIFAAGDVTGLSMVVHEATRQAVVAATNAALGTTATLPKSVSPMGSFTDPEYASVGVTQATAGNADEIAVAKVNFDALPRPTIDGRPAGFCKIIADRRSHRILGCHIVGERAVELAQVAATAMAASIQVEQFARVPFSFPTYANALGRAAIAAASELDQAGNWAADHLAAGDEPGAPDVAFDAPGPDT